MRPALNGAFSATGVPAGEYRIAALTDVEDDEWRTAAFLESLIDTSIPVVVRAGDTTRQDIRIR
jgi:hypothetical protein